MKRTIEEIEEDVENYTLYKYHGQIAFLNKYLIEKEKYEYIGYELIDKSDSNSKYIIGFPHFSKDKKQLATIHINQFDVEALFETYEINNNKIKSKLNVCFPNWVPEYKNESDECKNVFFSDDNWLYLKIELLNKTNPESISVERTHYIRIKLK